MLRRLGGEEARRHRVLVGPKGPVLLLALMVFLVCWSLVTSLTDVAIPTLRGEDPFGHLFHLADKYGPGYLFAHVFLHNLGLACLVPGLGLLAASFEKNPRLRRLIAPILLGTNVVSLVVGIEYLLQTGMAREHGILGLALAEAVAVIALAVGSYPHVRDYVPTPAPGWSLMTPMRRILPYFAFSAVLLVAASAWETWVLIGS